ncbi:matrixin family metalloprotease [Lacimicrobium sp. SS2-24]|uniref:matrixin family metalloprotease n=1 Tax=Lacimicrobium sp. SS2-24 TaxID=2005569 RepID=UPI000B4BA395|nr:matrixin family metalloprotease [Lacimicrobium sp. SS2-24]
MRSSIRTTLLIPALFLAGIVSLLTPLLADADEGGYRLLELEGYKVKWGDRRLGVGATVSYAFTDSALHFEDARNCGELASIESLTGQELSKERLSYETAEAFRVWERAAGLTFYEINDPRNADIILGAQGKPSGIAFANVAYGNQAEEGIRAIEQSLVCLNPEHKWKIGFDGDEDVYDIRYTLIHEIGHAIGLDHPGPSGQVMAFRYTEAFTGLQSGDLRGVQLLYGNAADNNQAGIVDIHTAQGPNRVNKVDTRGSQSKLGVAESDMAAFNGMAESKP